MRDVTNIITCFSLDDFPLTEEERVLLRLPDGDYLRRKLADTFLDGLGWSETAASAVDAWRIAYR